MSSTRDYGKKDPSPRGMISPAEARYREASMIGRRCENCAMFMDGSHCTLVTGDIAWDHVCDYFEWKR